MTNQGYRILVVEQTETPEQLELRRREQGAKDKVIIIPSNLPDDPKVGGFLMSWHILGSLSNSNTYFFLGCET